MNLDMVSSMPAAKTIAAKKLAADPIACCTPVRTDVLHEDQATILAHSFAALADPIRLRLLSFITSSTNEVCACDLVEPSGRSQPTVSHHMKILVDAGLVSREKRGLWVWYRAVPQRLDALRSVLG
jgi:ArsR family transcriptional regulator, arsenate/arsenite/antimonite-responsive transcriptional repressor